MPCPPPLISISRRQGQVAVGLLLLLFMGCDLLQVLRDHRLSPTDSTMFDYSRLWEAVSRHGPTGFFRLVDSKTSLVAHLVYVLNLAIQEPLIASRVLNVLAHGATLLLVFAVAIRLGLGRGFGLLAMLLSATTPMQYGWFRLDYHDPLVALAVMATLYVMLEGLDRWESGIKLGLAILFGLLAKLTYPVFIFFPGLVWALLRVKRRRQVMVLALALSGPAFWLAIQHEQVLILLGKSKQLGEPLLAKLSYYIWGHDGTLPAVLAAGVGMSLAWWRRTASREALGILALVVFGAIVLLVGIFDSWTRYMMPIFPLAALLSAAGVKALTTLTAGDARRRQLARWLVGLLVVALVTKYGLSNVRGMETHEPREHASGMIAADRRPYTAYPRVVAALNRDRQQAVMLVTSEISIQSSIMLPWYWAQRGHHFPSMTQEQARSRLAAGEPLLLVLGFGTAEFGRVRRLTELDFSIQLILMDKQKQMPLLEDMPDQLWPTIRRRKLRQVQSFSDPGMRFALVQALPGR